MSKTKTQHVWYFQSATAGNPDGPFSGKQLKALIMEGKVRKGDMLSSATATKGQWVHCESIAPVAAAIDSYSKLKKDQKAAAKKHRVEKKRAASAERQEQKDNARQQQNEANSRAAWQASTHATIDFESGIATCCFCKSQVQPDVLKCLQCGEFLNVAARQQHLYNTAPEKWNRGVAAVLSFLFPGVGQIYKGQIVNGFCFMVATILGYFCFIIPGLIFHLCSIIGATMGDTKQ